MGLFDSVISALGQGSSGSHADLLHEVVGMLGQGGAGGPLGGLGNLVEQFQQGGLGHVVQSWIGTGQNLPISADQLSRVLSSDTLAGMASKLGLNQTELLGQLSQVLPQVVDHLTPNGQLPEAGAGGLGDLAGMLGGLLNRR